MEDLDKSIQYIKGVGPKRASKLKRLGILTLRDLFYFIPRGYEDRSQFLPLRESISGQKSSHKVKIIGSPIILRPKGKLSILKVPVNDSSGYAELVWFNQPYLKEKFTIGSEMVVNGKINRIGMNVQIMNPVFADLNDMHKIGIITPLYSLTDGLANSEISKIIQYILEEYMCFIEEFLPETIKVKYNLLSINQALRNIHFPTNFRILDKARKTLAFQELLSLQLGLFIIKNRNNKDESGIAFKSSLETPELKQFINSLPFNLTNAQKNVFWEVEQDMEKEKQMNRLVQGDVGSGKTVIAVLAMYKSYLSGYQSVMMAPTEILAVQHFRELKSFYSKVNIRCEILTGSLKEKEKRYILEELRSGKIDVLVGTHAVIQDGVEFENLGMAITDEQHRFGVKQRAILTGKGNNPDTIVMTATPIPRTLALILYGDLDISVIDELPPGRKEIETYSINESLVDRMNEFIKKQIKEGRQAYIVCPLIEESETININSAEELYLKFKRDTFKEFNVGLIHGKMKNSEKDIVMNDFKDNKVQILVSTTVIEVGVNVPNSNIIAIYNAERFGLAQLHQLRGRVGRGEYQSYCILINASKNKISQDRMKILERSSNGFEISEKDLEIRGPGEFFGTRQHGIPELKVANLISDIEILKVVQREANRIIKIDPELVLDEHIKLRLNVQNMFKKIDEKLIFN